MLYTEQCLPLKSNTLQAQLQKIFFLRSSLLGCFPISQHIRQSLLVWSHLSYDSLTEYHEVVLVLFFLHVHIFGLVFGWGVSLLQKKNSGTWYFILSVPEYFLAVDHTFLWEPHFPFAFFCMKHDMAKRTRCSFGPWGLLHVCNLFVSALILVFYLAFHSSLETLSGHFTIKLLNVLLRSEWPPAGVQKQISTIFWDSHAINALGGKITDELHCYSWPVVLPNKFSEKDYFLFWRRGKKDMTILQQGALTEKAGSFMKNNELEENYSEPFRPHMLPF